MKYLQKILCFLNFHKEVYEGEILSQGDGYEQGNNRWTCSHCDWKTEWKSYYYFGPFEFKLDDEKL